MDCTTVSICPSLAPVRVNLEQIIVPVAVNRSRVAMATVDKLPNVNTNSCCEKNDSSAGERDKNL